MAKQPNILFIFTDQQRLSAVGAYGQTPCRTPRIDQLAAEGFLFENAYTTYPVCSPAHGTVMTGQYPHANGITGNVGDTGCAVHELRDRPELLSRRLESAGYALGYSGKWHLGTDRKTVFGMPNTPSLPRDVGFEGHNFPGHANGGYRLPEYEQYLAAHGYQHKVKPWAEKTPNIWNSGELEGPVESTVEYFAAENSISLMEKFRGEGKPFFMWHNFWTPHFPYFVPSQFLDMYRNVEIPPWPNYDWPSRQIPGPHQVVIHPDHERLTWKDWAMMVRYYYALTTLVDQQIGRMVDYLKTSGQLDNTVILFSSDHGETLGSHGGLTDKGWCHFEEIQRIPMILRMPGAGTPARRFNELVSLADVYPTILDLAGATWDEKAIHGQSLMGLVNGTATTWRDAVVTEFSALNNLGMTLRTLRMGNLKYGFNCGCKDELYDLDRDPHEMTNLIDHADYQGALAKLRDRLVEWLVANKDPMAWWTKRMLSYHKARKPYELNADGKSVS